MENNNNMNEERIKRFGEITLLDIDNIIEGGYIRMCNEDDYMDSIIVTIDEIMSIYTLSSTNGYIFLETQNNKFYYKDGYLEIEAPFLMVRFTKKDFIEFGNYIFELERRTYGKEC